MDFVASEVAQRADQPALTVLGGAIGGLGVRAERRFEGQAVLLSPGLLNHAWKILNDRDLP